jgi:hypothetical protein
MTTVTTHPHRASRALRPLRPLHRLSALALALATAITAMVLGSRCGVEAFVNVTIGPLRLDVPIPVEAIPPAMIAQDGTLMTLSCQRDADCPASPSAGVVTSCVASACALSGLTIDGTSAAVDLDENAVFRDFASMLQSVRVRRAVWSAKGFPAGDGLGPLELWWDAAGSGPFPTTPSHLLGTLPRVDPTTPSIVDEIAIDAVGAAALSSQLVDGGRVVRFRVRGPLRVSPGSTLPAAVVRGSLSLVLNLDATP